MKVSTLCACALLLGSMPAHAGPKVQPTGAGKLAAAPHGLADSQSVEIADRIVARWEKSLRQVRGWDDGALAHFRRELAGIPSATLKQAHEVANWDTLQAILVAHQGEAAAARLAKAAEDWRTGASFDETNVEEAELKRGITKALGDGDKDLVFIPIQPCTVWDTRFAQPGPHVGAIGPTANKPGFVYTSGAGAYNWSAYGGNPSCTDTSVVANYGVVPYAVAYTLYTADATANGWVTAYRDGDPDPSSATISLYYTPGPTRSTTIVTRVGRATGQPYDIRVASQYGTVHVAVSVIGYFIRSAATSLECQTLSGPQTNINAGATGSSVATCPAGYRVTGGACTNFFTGGLEIDSSIDSAYTCWARNVGGGATTLTARAQCCRVPGR